MLVCHIDLSKPGASINKMLCTILVALMLAGMDGTLAFAEPMPTPVAKQESASAETLPTAEQSLAITSLPDAELEAAIRATAPDYRVDIVGVEGDIGKARYATARNDLNGDGKDEVFFYLTGPYFCVTGGCSLLVFSQAYGYSLLASIPTSDPPVIVAQRYN
jgi:hypothetical protein